MLLGAVSSWVARTVLGKVPWKYVLWGLLAVSLAGSIYLGFRHYQGLVEQRDELLEERGRLERDLENAAETVSTLERRVEEWRDSQERLQARFRDLQDTNRRAQQELRRLNDIFSRHDLTELARAKPGLIERRINDGTRRVFDLVECASDPACGGPETGPSTGPPAPEPGADPADRVEGADAR